MIYKVKLESFEGPLDLLLFLIRKNEVDIYNIPIAVITQQFLEYLEIIQLLDLETASDFILMAATLMRIKAQMLLPKPVLEESQEELEDPRQELVFRLLEYKRFKDIAVDLAEKETEARKLFPRGRFLLEREEMEEELLQDSDVTLFDLIGAFRKLLEQSKKVSVHHIQESDVTLDERIEFIKTVMAAEKELRFFQLFKKGDSKLVWIITLIALLELIKQHVIRAFQEKPFGDIILTMVNGKG